MADFTADLLDRPAVQAACSVALAYLDDAKAAVSRLGDHTDREALHDFRVAIRRLRVTVRAYPGLHEGVPRKQRRRLRKLARATNSARDADVQITWFRERSRRFTPAQRAALGPLRARLRARRRRELARTELKLQRWFDKIERKLRRRLIALQSDAGVHQAPFRAVAAATLVQHAGELSTRLEETSPAAAPRELHATRIAAKRLRYLLEPAKPGLPDGAQLVDRLKSLQDLFGALTDAHELEVALQDGAAAAAAAMSVLRVEVGALFTKLKDEWSKTGPDLERDVEAIAQRLRPAAKRPRSFEQRTRRRRQDVTA
jgi:CHAD domain-containing protein